MESPRGMSREKWEVVNGKTKEKLLRIKTYKTDFVKEAIFSAHSSSKQDFCKEFSRDLLLGSQEESLNSKTCHSLKIGKYSGWKEEKRERICFSETMLLPYSLYP